MNAKQQLVVIGNGMVSYKLCDTLIENKGLEWFDVTVFGDEPHPAYDRVHLSEYFSEKTMEDLTLEPLSWYEENNITLYTGERITLINREEKVIVSANGRTIPYDKLVLATGSSAFVPPMKGVDKKGVFVYRTIEDLDAIKAYSQQAKSAAVIGGGLLGLEAAKATHDLGLQTHVIELAPFLMARQLDDKAGTLLKNKIEELGVQVHTNTKTQQIAGDESVNKLVFAAQDDAPTELPIDMVVISAGISPNDQLARDCGLEVGKRAGVVIDNFLQTSDPNIYAIGECALHENMIYGLVGPGYQMATTLADNLLGDHAERQNTEGSPTGSRPNAFTGADMSTQLKLMGVDVASFGDIENKDSYPVTLEDHGAGVYKKLIISKDGKHLIGGILVGDTSDYAKLVSLYQAEQPVPKAPETLFIQSQSSESNDAFSVAFLPASAVVCSCNNVTKGDLVTAIREGTISDFNQLKKCSKAGTTCGGCGPLVKDILTLELENIGVVVDRSLCEHFAYDRKELRSLIQRDKLFTFQQVLTKHGRGNGCEVCRPTVASILAGCWNEHVMQHHQIQDTNDYFMANMQKNGTYSVVPRVPGGEITPNQLIALGQVAQEFNLYTKVTGAQRIDLFGAQSEDLPKIWKRLVDAGMETGQAYGKALRAVKSCVGATWCRFGVQDSTALAIDLENRYKGIRSPHKIKGGVSGCVRECAEARCKDFGVIATEKGWNVYICGNGGAKPQHAVILAEDVDRTTVFKYIDRFLMYYIQTADHLTRTATWLNKLEGGIEKLKDVIINDALGIGDELEAEMQALVDSYQCEWATTLKDPEKLKRFQPFLNSIESDSTVQFKTTREQIRPTEMAEAVV